jgi:peptidoglycan hydrolase-like protein with peptidoglycan-binding domain
MQTAPTPDRIMDIQSALAKAGAYDGEPTGNWDAKTIAAMTKFQQSNGLTPSGKLDALSLQKLGLGSDTAGKGAPRPATPSTTVSSSTGIRR